MWRHVGRAAGVALLFTLATSGCRLGRGPSIAEIRADPTKYDGKVVVLTGVVRRPVQIFGYGTCQLDDGTGQLTVITTGKSLSAGRKATLRGTIHSAFSLGTKTMLVLVEEGTRKNGRSARK